jgi:hypothetical protein
MGPRAGWQFSAKDSDQHASLGLGIHRDKPAQVQVLGFQTRLLSQLPASGLEQAFPPFEVASHAVVAAWPDPLARGALQEQDLVAAEQEYKRARDQRVSRLPSHALFFSAHGSSLAEQSFLVTGHSIGKIAGAR